MSTRPAKSIGKKQTYLTKNRGYILIATLALVGIALLLQTAGVFNTPSKPRTTAPHTASQSTKGEPSTTVSPQNSPTTTSQPGDNKSATGTNDSTAVLLDPTGNFVSTHHLSLSGSSGSNTLQSSCNTTPSATCKISFTKDGTVKSLSEQITDRGGAAYWTWKLQDIGLTEGTWHITAIATLGSQTKSAEDALTLEVSQ